MHELARLHHDAERTSLARRWRLVSDFLRRVFVSSRVKNAEAPVNVLLVGPAGDGKTRMVLRGSPLPFVRTYSDISPKGLYSILDVVKNEYASTVIIPDLGTVIGRKYEVGKQVLANLAMLAAEGVGRVLVAGRERDYEGLRVSLVTAMSDVEFIRNQGMLLQNGFLSRMVVVNFEFTAKELRHMQARKVLGDRSLMAPFHYARGVRHFPRLTIGLPASWAARTHAWWDEAMGKEDATIYGFRTADVLNDLLRASAYLHYRGRVTERDVRYIERFREVWEHPVKVAASCKGRP